MATSSAQTLGEILISRRYICVRAVAASRVEISAQIQSRLVRELFETVDEWKTVDMVDMEWIEVIACLPAIHATFIESPLPPFFSCFPRPFPRASGKCSDTAFVEPVFQPTIISYSRLRLTGDAVGSGHMTPSFGGITSALVLLTVEIGAAVLCATNEGGGRTGSDDIPPC
jgi:hypothetical protein